MSFVKLIKHLYNVFINRIVFYNRLKNVSRQIYLTR